MQLIQPAVPASSSAAGMEADIYWKPALLKTGC